MNNKTLLWAGLFLTGCVSQTQLLPSVTANPAPVLVSAALAFDPPITLAEPPIDLSRANRGQAALVGYEQSTVSYYDVVNDNRQSSDYSDRVVRESVTERVGSIRR